MEVPWLETWFAAVRSPSELAPAELPLLDVWLPEEPYPGCLSVVVRSPQKPTPAGRSTVVQLREELAPAGTSPAVVQLWGEPTPAGILTVVVWLRNEPTPAGPLSTVARFLEELTPAGKSARDLAGLRLREEPKPAELPLLLRELDDHLWECLSQWEYSASWQVPVTPHGLYPTE